MAIPARTSQTLDQPSLERAGVALGSSLQSGEVVWLEGDLGAGKTTFAQAICRGLGIETAPTSPTYNLVHRYESPRGAVYHVDCFRLINPDQAADLDWEGLSRSTALLVEWPERAGSWAIQPTRRVRLGHVGDEALRVVDVEDLR